MPTGGRSRGERAARAALRAAPMVRGFQRPSSRGRPVPCINVDLKAGGDTDTCTRGETTAAYEPQSDTR